MSTIVLPMASSPLKRTATDAELDCAPLNPESNNTRDRHTLDEGDRETLSHAHTTQEPVAQGTNETSDIDPSNIHPMPHSTIASPDVSQADAAASSNNPAKRRKLTFAEKEAQKIEKAHKELRKKEELARKEEEKAKKEEEKVRKEQEKKAREEEKRAKEELKENERKKREEEKEEKRKVKEAEKVAKDEEKKRKDAEKKVKEDEKSKKERAQLRLNSFFTNPKPFPQGPDSPLRGENLTPTRRNSVASSRGGSKASSRASSICPEPRKSDWERCYPPFFLHAYTTLAPNNRFRKAKKPQLGKISAIEQLDCLVNGEDSAKATTHTKPLLPMPTRSKPRLVPLPPTRDIIDRINGTLIHPIDLTKPSSDPSPLQLLGALPVKYLKYYEDVRPPYIGTFTRRPTSSRSLSKICRRPCASRDLPGTNYDYDSEAEWEEPDEGEDLDSEGELDEEGDDDADDLDGFLDDEGAEQARKRIFGGDMIPVQTGLCWDDGKKGSKEVDFGESKLDLKTLGIRGLLADLAFPIDPYSTAYWPSTALVAMTSSPSVATPSGAVPKVSPSQSRLPLNLVSTSTSNLPFPHLTQQSHNPSKLSSTTLVSDASVTAPLPVTNAGKPPKKPFPSELLQDLKKAVEGSDLTKAGLVEILKKRFPKVGKDAIHYTLGLIAERVGKSESEKRWVLK